MKPHCGCPVVTVVLHFTRMRDQLPLRAFLIATVIAGEGRGLVHDVFRNMIEIDNRPMSLSFHLRRGVHVIEARVKADGMLLGSCSATLLADDLDNITLVQDGAHA
eukprot:Phypoly_transcript_21235.p1 GENE.Phypoly_transcript_21235~~Phypoly_transcript_21235.p1  ORF type:complete len:119 (+),score=11.33 Phypoly_transcript_21235:41-358(+)